jgi:hypothetical protein
MQGGGTTGVGREKAEGGRQDADHGSGNTVYANLPSDHMGIGVVSLPPKCVGKNSNMVSFMSPSVEKKIAALPGSRRLEFNNDDHHPRSSIQVRERPFWKMPMAPTFPLPPEQLFLSGPYCRTRLDRISERDFSRTLVFSLPMAFAVPMRIACGVGWGLLVWRREAQAHGRLRRLRLRRACQFAGWAPRVAGGSPGRRRKRRA